MDPVKPLALIISPLYALVKDQVLSLRDIISRFKVKFSEAVPGLKTIILPRESPTSGVGAPIRDVLERTLSTSTAMPIQV
jgi:hypothetical protein